MTTFQTIIEILKDGRDIDEASIKPETTFLEIGLDSLDTVDLVMRIEEKLGVNIPMDENLKNIGNVVEYIDNIGK